jgi:hypothetical protein
MKLESNLGILDRMNVAHCAAERARMYVCDTERFNGEFDTVRMWKNYNCTSQPTEATWRTTNGSLIH